MRGEERFSAPEKTSPQTSALAPGNCAFAFAPHNPTPPSHFSLPCTSHFFSFGHFHGCKRGAPTRVVIAGDVVGDPRRPGRGSEQGVELVLLHHRIDSLFARKTA